MRALNFLNCVLALAATVLLGACGRTVALPRSEKCVFDSDCSDGLRCVNQECTTFEIPDGGPLRGKKRFGQPCDAGIECGSTFCVGGPAGSFCTAVCGAGDAGCPGSYNCNHLPDPNRPDAGISVNVCTVPQPLLCQDCTDDFDCGASGADKCLELSGGRFCGRDCTFTGCPTLYECRSFPGGIKQCAPEGRTCDCVAETVGLEKGCRGSMNQFGSCPGNQTCQVDGGFTGCVAPAALEETCNGADDDCNGAIDDFTAPECTRTVGNVTCRGPQVCFASAGLVCTARTPADEACNYEDDDCDGDVDEDFRPIGGVYSTPRHCGACNNDCSKIIAHAAVTNCSAAGNVARCTVSVCEPGYFPYANNTMCLELPDTLCSPCQVDADCVGPQSRCLTVDGAKVCGRDCSPTSASRRGALGVTAAARLALLNSACPPPTPAVARRRR